jgi:4-hydroxybutyryl-CoA dehydratase/vinylacetyl-CoA-Delta-isomerase
MNAVAAASENALKPEYEDILTATSHLAGRKINRFTHIHQSVDDLVKKSKMGHVFRDRSPPAAFSAASEWTP